MRYRHSSHLNRREKLILFALALLIFGYGAVQADRKIDRQSKASQIVSSPKFSPSPRHDALANLRFIDLTTGQPIVNQEITFIPHLSETGSVVITTDTQGQLTVSPQLLYQKPEISSPGYQKDLYFTFLDQAQPDQLTLLKNLPGTKINYQLDREIVPIALSPLAGVE